MTPRPVQLLTLEQVGERLSASRDSVERFIARGELAAVDIGTARRPRLRVAEAEVERFVAARTLSGPTGRRNGAA